MLACLPLAASRSRQIAVTGAAVATLLGQAMTGEDRLPHLVRRGVCLLCPYDGDVPFCCCR